jgi:hypothetical protein
VHFNDLSQVGGSASNPRIEDSRVDDNAIPYRVNRDVPRRVGSAESFCGSFEIGRIEPDRNHAQVVRIRCPQLILSGHDIGGSSDNDDSRACCCVR